MWAEDNLNGTMISSHGNSFYLRVNAYTSNFHFTAFNHISVTQGYEEYDNIEVEMESPLSVRFWKDFHFKSNSANSVYYASNSIYNRNVTRPDFEILRLKYDFSYVIGDKLLFPLIPEDELKFSDSVDYSCYKIYESQRGVLWLL
jgi:hypothetical protein